MAHPIPPLSGENLLLDDEDVILLTDEIPPAENHDLIEICQITDRCEPREVAKLSEAKENPAFIDLSDVITPPEAEYQIDDLQRLIDEVVHDSQVPPQDFSGTFAEISEPKDSPIVKDDLTSLSQDQIDAAMERVVRNLFTEKIEPILDELIITTVTREIEKLKKILLDYLTSGKTVHKTKSHAYAEE